MIGQSEVLVSKNHCITQKQEYNKGVNNIFYYLILPDVNITGVFLNL